MSFNVCILDEDPERIDTFVQLLADGATREAIGKVFNVTPWTITQWKKRTDVQRKLTKVIRERANRILSLTDSKLEGLLQQQGKKLSVDQLIKIRQAFAGEIVNLKMEGDGASALKELMAAMHEDPELAKALSKLGLEDAA